jgi:cytochrome c oxidase cbb3-type subunit 2
MASPEPPAARRGAGRARLAGMGAVAATYVFFLLWAQFGFVDLLRERLAGPVGGAAEVRAAMAAMGIAGLAASFAAAALLARVPARRLVRLGLLAAPASALAALACRGLPAFVAVAAATGAATAVLTVSLAAGLRSLLPGPRLGLTVGAATGTAYLVCNLPAVFEAPPWAQVSLVALACGVAWKALGGARGAADPASAPGPALFSRHLYRRPGLAAMVTAFLALVWIDSAAFAAVQGSPELAAGTWGTAAGKVVLGVAHLVAAVAAGALLDAGLLPAVLAGTAGLFGVALPLLAGAAAPTLAWGVLYAVGISAYSTALVVYPAGRGEEPGLASPRWRAALLYGVAGWLGSALGVGMVQDLHGIPGGAVAAAVAVVAVALAVASWAHPGAAGRLARVLRALLRIWGPALLLATAALGVLGLLGAAGAGAPEGAASAVERGRRVYRAEGCIHCHSQYVRPGTGDELLWGPHRPLDRAQAPPLLGVRRQGPDLAAVGNRRSTAWERIHLRHPRLLDPGSRMPSYAYLFAEEGLGGSSRGDDLVSYLGSLGRGTEPERQASVEAAPVPGAEAVRRASRAEGRRLFGRYCAACHGEAGRGDGPLAATLRRPGMDLGKGALWSVSWGVEGAEGEASALARVIRFGIPGSSMPGHESLTREQVADLVAYVETMVHRAAPRRGPGRQEGGP